jgi:hypothetical protein
MTVMWCAVRGSVGCGLVLALVPPGSRLHPVAGGRGLNDRDVE